ncbi:MAG: hypothetical protein HS117_23950 [Verrucomicrobiaceae bacterium]|jgi:hypothetical protein|nr:hypothetical protein [Verrucomicrobiaceae bacterium]
MKLLDGSILDNALRAVSDVLKHDGAAPEEVVICGGAALLSLGVISRRTKDVDVLAGVDRIKGLVDPRPFSAALERAVNEVARALGLPPNWFNAGPADQVMAGLPDGFLTRLQRRDFGSHLTVYVPDRFDLIHLKLFAGVDQGPGRHWSDLKALNPTADELLAAARWVMGQDAGDVFPRVLRDALNQHGHGHIADQL